MSISLSSDGAEKAIDEYHDSTRYSGSSSSSSYSSNGGSSTDEGYTSSVPGFPLEVIQEQLGRPRGPRLVPRPKSLRLVLWTRWSSLYIAVQ